MSVVHVRQIQAHLRKHFEPLIDMSDLSPGTKDDERAKHFSSRALAAFSLQMLSGLEATAAAKRITDGGQDHGIDALHFDAETQTLHIVQSKWHQDGGGTIKVGDALKVIEGVKMLLEDDSSAFGIRLRGVWDELHEDFIGSPSAKVVVCLIHTGTADLHDDIKKPVADYFSSVNDISEIISLKVVSQKDIHEFIAAGAQGKPVDLEMLLHDWGRVISPFDAVYGRVLASDVASWLTINSRDRLLSQNIRKILPDSTINDSIGVTLRDSPHLFWYCNNGITVLCDVISQRVVGAGTRDSGLFVAANASVVNGAQTAGAIAKLGDNSKLSQAYVQVRIISLKDCPDDFAKTVTRATNTQNRVEAKDFASLDPVQERLRKDLLVSGRQYLIKAGEKVVDPSTQCTAEEAAVALSCAADIGLATIAKNSVGRIWDDAPQAGGKAGAVYRRVFPENLDPNFLWNCVLTLREVDAVLQTQKGQGRLRNISVHGNRFIASQVFKRISRDRLHSTNYKVPDHVNKQIVGPMLAEVDAKFGQHFPGSYPGTLFKNQQKCQSLDDAIHGSMPSVTSEAAAPHV